jgi:hypothetical protein
LLAKFPADRIIVDDEDFRRMIDPRQAIGEQIGPVKNGNAQEEVGWVGCHFFIIAEFAPFWSSIDSL